MGGKTMAMVIATAGVNSQYGNSRDRSKGAGLSWAGAVVASAVMIRFRLLREQRFQMLHHLQGRDLPGQRLLHLSLPGGVDELRRGSGLRHHRSKRQRLHER